MRALFGIFVAVATLWAQMHPFKLAKSFHIPNTYYYTPLAVHGHVAAFGYIGKINPTPDEVRRERERIRHIIQASIEREYGSMQKWEEYNKKIGEQSAAQIQKSAPPWVRELLPETLVKEAVPFLLKGALLFAMHTKTSTEPYGNLGETGVVIVDEQAHKIKIGIDEPVVSLDFSPDGKLLAVMSDLSYEDKSGRYHAVARITLIDAVKYRIVHQWVFANAVDEVKFASNSILSFLVHNPAKWTQKAIRFIDLGSRRLMERTLAFLCGRSTEMAGSVKIVHPCYLFDPSHRVLLVRESGKIAVYDAATLQRRFVVPGTFFVGFAHKHPWFVERSGRVVDYAKKEVLRRFADPMKVGFVQGAFGPDDGEVIFSNHFRHFFVYDLASGSLRARTRHMMRDGGKLFVVTEDGKWIITQDISSKRVTYSGYLRRTKTGLKILDARSLRTVQRIELPPQQTVLEFGYSDGWLFASDFDTIYLFERE